MFRSSGTYFTGRQQHHGGAFQDLSGCGHLGSSPLVLEVVLPVTGQMGQFDHFRAELTEGFYEFREIVHGFQAIQAVRHLQQFATTIS